MNMQIKIRPANLQDWKTIQKLNNQVFQNDKNNDEDLDLNWPFSEEGVKYYKDLTNGVYGHCLVAELDGSAVGYVALANKNFGYRKGKYVEIENIGVSPDYRSLGIGTKLMGASEKWAKKQGANRLYVSAYWDNKKAIQFYKNNNFVEMGIEMEKNI
jgi:ribosomal protein S18 acetylase RimI-like enzyme